MIQDSLATKVNSTPNIQHSQASPLSTQKPDITFVCCVDSGWLEAQTLVMIESLRRWGGRFADAHIVAVTPRLGCPLSQQTHRFFKKFDVEYIHYWANHSYTWLPYVNKPHALATVEKRSSSRYIGWLDSDLMFVGEPDQLIPNQDIDFTACAADKNVGTSGSDDPFNPYWSAICNAIGIDLEALPWVTEHTEQQSLRLYWNSGIFTYRRSTEFGQRYLETCLQLIDGRRVPNVPGYFSIGMNEQIGLGLAMFKAGLSWQSLPFSHNFTVSHRSKHSGWCCEVQQLKQAKILHYHDSLLPEHWGKFLSYLQDTHPAVAEWVAQLGPMTSFAPAHSRFMGKLLEQYRSGKEAKYRQSCVAI